MRRRLHSERELGFAGARRGGACSTSRRSASAGSRSIVTGMLILIVATGATVRLTAPGSAASTGPAASRAIRSRRRATTPYIEFSNRIVAAFTVFATLALAIGATYTRAVARGVKTLAWLVFAGTLAQAPLGAITVYFDLNPWLVLSHLLLSFVVLGLGVLVVLEATRLVRGGEPALPRPARAAGARPPRGRGRPDRRRHARHRGGPASRRRRREAARLVPASHWTGTCARRPSSESCSWSLAVWAWLQPRALSVAPARRAAFCSSCSALRWRSARSQYRNQTAVVARADPRHGRRLRLRLDGRARRRLWRPVAAAST